MVPSESASNGAQHVLAVAEDLAELISQRGEEDDHEQAQQLDDAGGHTNRAPGHVRDIGPAPIDL
jgi:peptidyl-tRNA hydrolase